MLAELRAKHGARGREGRSRPRPPRQARAEKAARPARDRKLAEAERQVIEAKHQNNAREAELAAFLHAQKARSIAELKELESARGRQGAAAGSRDQAGRRRGAGGAGPRQPEIENFVSDDKIRLAMVETGLPALASAFAQKFGEVKFTSFGGDSADPSAMIGKGIAQVMELVKTVSNEVLSDRPRAATPE
jgi:hypothetical protein